MVNLEEMCRSTVCGLTESRNLVIMHTQVNWICDQYEKSKYGQRVSKLIEYSCATLQDTSELPAIFSEAPMPFRDFKKARSCKQIRWLTWRTYIDYKRNYSSHLLRFVTYMVRRRDASFWYIRSLHSLSWIPLCFLILSFVVLWTYSEFRMM